MRILHLASFLQGGAGRVIVDLAAEQHRAGHDVRIIASQTGVPGYGNYQAYLDELNRMGVPVRLVDSMFDRGQAANLSVVRAIDGWYLHGVEPDIIHAHAAVPSLVALLFAGARRVPIAILQTMHGWGVVKTADQVATDVSVLNLVGRVAVPSGHSAGILASLGVAPSRITIIPYGVRPDVTEPDDRDARTLHEMTKLRRQGALVVSCVGTIGHRKDQALLVDALAMLPDTRIFCVFAGDGEDAGLRTAIDKTGSANRVRIHGFSEAARRIGAAADLFVLPSRSEGQPIPVLEAFCDGTLVAVSDGPELAELVDDGATGFRFTAGNAASLAGTLLTVASLPNSTRRAIRERARSRYLNRFTVAAMAAAYFSLYEAITGTPHSDTRPESPAA